MKKKIRDDFRNVASFYENVIHSRKDNPWMNIVLSMETSRLLDIGGGTGRVLEAFHPQVSGLFLADFSLPMLAAARRKNLFCETCCLVEKLPYCENVFDCIIMVDAFHHLVHQQAAIDEALRVLKHGGIFILEEPDINKWGIKLIALGEKLLGMRSHFFRQEEIQKMLNAYSVQVENYTYTNNFYLVIHKI